jgi:DNA-binding CsgD family transcriptional regulator
LLGARASARPIEPAHVAPVAAYAVADRAHEFQPEPVPTRQLGIGLTRREHEVALLLARGLSNREVAEQLSISVKTAKNHVQRVLDKAGVHFAQPVCRLCARCCCLAPPTDRGSGHHRVLTSQATGEPAQERRVQHRTRPNGGSEEAAAAPVLALRPVGPHWLARGNPRTE